MKISSGRNEFPHIAPKAVSGDLNLWHSFQTSPLYKERSADLSLWCLLLLLLMAPLPLMIAFPLTDPTEARYAVIARAMWETKDFITPWFSPDTPFWGKPPLSFWLQSLSAGVFGDHAWAYRLPSWLSYVLTVGLILKVGRLIYSEKVALTAAIIYSSCALTMVSSVAVLTDTILNLGVFLSLASFIVYSRGGARVWGYLFFAGLAIGLLDKGPLGALLVAVPLAVAVAMRPRQYWPLLRQLPWIGGTMLTAVLVLPWYIAAEIKTPGFLYYFLWGEHVLRFIDPGWQGDHYGTAHKRPLGTMIGYGLMATAPWSVIVVLVMIRQRFSKQNKNLAQTAAVASSSTRRPGFELFLFAAAAFPILFFSLCANVLWTYALPAVPVFSLLAARYLALHNLQGLRWIAPLVATIAIIAFSAVELSSDSLKTEKNLVAYVHSTDHNASLYYWDEVPFSGRYYSHENVRQFDISKVGELEQLAEGQEAFVAVPKQKVADLQAYLQSQLNGEDIVQVTGFENLKYGLLRVAPVQGVARSDRPRDY